MKKLTARQLFTKFPKLACGPCNVAKLEDMACPACGFRERFRITMVTFAEVTDDESAADVGVHEWHDSSYCRCDAPNCVHHGKFRDFIFKGLDDLVAEVLLNDTERIAQAMATHRLSDAAWEALPRDEQLGYSRKLSNHRYAIALFAAAYYFCKVHTTLGCTPAVGLKLATETWTIERLIEEATSTI
jgi:hypothetical protein